MTIEEARGLAASAWCKNKTSRKIMDPDLCEEFALIIIAQDRESREVQWQESTQRRGDGRDNNI
jgi:hypothetical protein